MPRNATSPSAEKTTTPGRRGGTGTWSQTRVSPTMSAHQRQVGHETRGQHGEENGQRAGGRDLEAAQDVVLAFLDHRDARAEKAVAEHAKGQHDRDDLQHLARVLRPPNIAANMKKKKSGNRYVKNSAVLLRDSSRRAFSCGRGRAAGISIPGKRAAGQRDERVFEAGAAYGDVFEAQPVLVAPAHELGDAFARLVGAQEQLAPVVAPLDS